MERIDDDINPLAQSVIWDPKESHEPIEPQIANCQIKFLEEVRPLMPMHQKELKNKFYKMKEQVYPIMLETFDDPISQVDELDYLLEKRVFALGELENVKVLEARSLKNILAFIKAYNLAIKVDPETLNTFIVDSISEDDNVLADLNANLKLTDKVANTEICAIGDINKSLIVCLNVIQLYLHCLFNKYEIEEHYECKIESYNEVIYEALRKKCQEGFKLHYKTINQTLEKHYDICKEKIKNMKEASMNSSQSSKNTIKHWADLYRVLKRVEVTAFIEDVKSELEFEPCIIFLWSYKEKIEKELQFTHECIQSLRNDFTFIENVINPELSELFKQYYETNEIDIFHPKQFQAYDLITIYEILTFTNYGIRDSSLWDKSCYPKLSSLLDKYILPKLDSFSNYYMQSLLKMTEKHSELEKNRLKMNYELGISIKKWAEVVNRKKEILMPTLFSVFVYLSNSIRGNKYSRYKSFYRKMIAQAFRNFSNGENRYSNFQVLSILENLYEKHSLRYAGDKNSLESSEINSGTLKSGEKKQPEVSKIPKSVKNTMKLEILKLATDKKSLESMINVNNVIEVGTECIPKSVEKPSKFYIERITKNEAIRSKHIILGVSG